MSSDPEKPRIVFKIRKATATQTRLKLTLFPAKAFLRSVFTFFLTSLSPGGSWARAAAAPPPASASRSWNSPGTRGQTSCLKGAGHSGLRRPWGLWVPVPRRPRRAALWGRAGAAPRRARPVPAGSAAAPRPGTPPGERLWDRAKRESNPVAAGGSGEPGTTPAAFDEEIGRTHPLGVACLRTAKRRAGATISSAVRSARPCFSSSRPWFVLPAQAHHGEGGRQTLSWRCGQLVRYFCRRHLLSQDPLKTPSDPFQVLPNQETSGWSRSSLPHESAIEMNPLSRLGLNSLKILL